MASRVNMKLVVALIVGLAAVGGGAIGLYALVLNKTPEDNVRAGDEAMASQDYLLAKRMFSRAVNREPNNVEWLQKWRAAMEAWKPASDTEFDNEFSAAYLPMLRGLATAQPTKVEPSLEYLGVLYEQVARSQFARGFVERLDAETEALLAIMNNAAPNDPQRLKIRRFRGLMYVGLQQNQLVVTPEQIQLAEEDLRAALDADPTDGEVAVGLARVFVGRATEARKLGRSDLFLQAQNAAIKVLDDHLLRNPNDPEVLLNRLAASIDAAQEEATRGLVGGDIQRALIEVNRRFAPQFEELVTKLAEIPDVSVRGVLSRLEQIERVITPASANARTLDLLNKRVESNPHDSEALVMIAQLHLIRRDFQKSLEALEAISNLPPLPVSMAGSVQRNIKTYALQQRADVTLQIRETTPAAEEARRAELLAQAKSLRDEYAKRVAGNDTSLVLLDALLAQSSGELRPALNKIQQYNQLRSNQDVRGLWLEGQIAQALNEDGRAQRAFRTFLDIQPNNPSALIALAGTEVRLQNPQAAIELYNRAAAIDPNNAAVADAIRALQIQLGLEVSDDPVQQVLVEAGRAMRGDGQTLAGTVEAAIQILRDGATKHNHDPRISLQLASLLLENGDLDGAREAVRLSSVQHPNHDRLGVVANALAANDLLSAFTSLVDSTEVSDLDKILNKRTIYTRFGALDEARRMIAEAVRVAPDDLRVIDLQFSLALTDQDTAAARTVYDSAMKRGLLPYNGLVYRGQLEAAEGKRPEAIATLTQAIELGADQAPVWRLLGSQQYESGQQQQAITSFQRAYDIRPNDMANVKPLLEILRLNGRLEDALNIARQAERFGRNDPQFLNFWLRLEATSGGEAGRNRAMIVREQMVTLMPDDRVNAIELANIYIDMAADTASRASAQTRADFWQKSRKIIDDLKAKQHDLMVTMLEARWNADQGRVTMPDGTTADGIDQARGVFIEYILAQGDDVDSTPYIELARFMTTRGRYGIARQSLEQAREHQTPQLEADKVLAFLMIEQALYAEAEPLLRNVVENNADDADQTYRIQWIEMLLRTGQHQKADEQLATLNPNKRELLPVLLQRSEAADGLGRTQEAVDLLNRAVASYPQEALAYTRRAQYRLRDANLIEDVLLDLQQALNLEPQNTQTLQLRAGVFGSIGRYDDMLRDLVASLRVNPNQMDILQGVLVEYILRGEDGRAMDIAEEAINQRPRDLMLIARAARVFEDRILWTRAAELYRRGWEASGDHAFGLAYINALISQQPPRITDADRVMRQIRSLGEPIASDWTVNFADAAIRHKRGQRAEAEQSLIELFDRRKSTAQEVTQWWRNVQAIYGDDMAGLRAFLNRMLPTQSPEADSTLWLRFFLGQVLVQSESFKPEGYAMLAELQNLGADSQFARYAFRQAGSALYAEEKHEEALALWSKGLDLFPGDWEMCNNSAFLLATKLERPHDALPFARSAVASAPQQSEAFDTLARVYVRLNQYPEAEEALASATRFATNKRAEVSLLITRAELDIKRNELARARRGLERLLLSLAPLPDLRRDYEAEVRDLLRRVDSLEG